MPRDPQRLGLGLLRLALVTIAVLALGIGAWTIDKALENPDVHLRRPGWLGEQLGFAGSFWIPLLVTVLLGGALVFSVFWRAFRRMQAGEDLYAGRYRKPEPPA